jgi:hypothetical protein
MARLDDFCDNYYTNRMREVREGRLHGDQLSDDEKERAKETGVVWKTSHQSEMAGNPHQKSMLAYWGYMSWIKSDRIETDYGSGQWVTQGGLFPNRNLYPDSAAAAERAGCFPFLETNTSSGLELNNIQHSKRLQQTDATL